MSIKSTLPHLTSIKWKHCVSISTYYVCLMSLCCSAFYAAGRSRTGHQTSTRPDRQPAPVDATRFPSLMGYSVETPNWSSEFRHIGCSRFRETYLSCTQVHIVFFQIWSNWHLCLSVDIFGGPRSGASYLYRIKITELLEQNRQPSLNIAYCLMNTLLCSQQITHQDQPEIRLITVEPHIS